MQVVEKNQVLLQRFKNILFKARMRNSVSSVAISRHFVLALRAQRERKAEKKRRRLT